MSRAFLDSHRLLATSSRKPLHSAPITPSVCLPRPLLPNPVFTNTYHLICFGGCSLGLSAPYSRASLCLTFCMESMSERLFRSPAMHEYKIPNSGYATPRIAHPTPNAAPSDPNVSHGVRFFDSSNTREYLRFSSTLRYSHLHLPRFVNSLCFPPLLAIHGKTSDVFPTSIPGIIVSSVAVLLRVCSDIPAIIRANNLSPLR